MHIETNAAVRGITDEPREPCPTPLAWQQVLAAFRNESEPWDIDRGAYRIRGRTWGSGPPVYFLNGFGGTLELFSLTVWLLREQFRCVLFDYPLWRSATGSTQATIDDFAADLFAIADHHGDERFALFGSSFGSAVALSAMLREPDRIERAVLQNAFAYRRLTLAERMLASIGRRSSRSLGDYRWRVGIQAANHRHWFPPHDPSRWQFLLEDTGRVPVAALAQRGLALRTFDLRPSLKKNAQPTCLIQTEGDGRLTAACHAELERGLPNVRSEWLHTSGQLPFLTHPHRLAKIIRQFLQTPVAE